MPEQRNNVGPYARKLASIARDVAKSRLDKIQGPLFDAFLIFAAAADTSRAAKVVDLMYG